MLVATLILPLLTSVAFGAVWARDRRAEAQHAQTVADQIDMLSVLSQLQFGIESNRLYRGLSTSLLPANVATTTASDAAPKSARLWENGAKLVNSPDELNALTNGTGATVLKRVIDRHVAQIADPNLPELDDNLSGSATDLSSLISLVRSNADRDAVAKTAVFDQFSELQALMLIEAKAFIATLASPEQSQSNVLDIFETGAREDALIDQIVTRLPSKLRHQLLTGLAGDDMAKLRAAVGSDAGIGDKGPSFNETLTPELLKKVQTRYYTLPEIRGELADQVKAESDTTIREANRWVRSSLALAIALAAMIITTAVTISRVVVRRLELLARAASRIGDGDIDEDPLPPGGPREIAEVTIAFNRMSDLLLTLDRQVGAIGNARLDDPSLDKTLPGRIGSEIQQSVRLIATTNESLRAAQALAAAIIEAAVDAIITVGADGVIRSANPAANAVAGRSSDDLEGEQIADLFPNLPSFERLIHSPDSIAVTLQRAGLDPVPTLISAREIQGSDGAPARAFFIRDISERAAWEERFRYQATHDELTGLPNRFALGEYLQAVEADDDRHAIAVLCIDIDRFKYVNDAHGHHNGDQVMQVVADRLRSSSSAAYAARVDGDEFAVVIRPSGDPFLGANGTHASHEEAAEEVARQIAAELSEAIEIPNERLVLQSCIGIAVAHHAADGTENLLRFAEVAMSIAKESGTGSVRVYDGTMSDLIERRTRLEQRLRTALATEQLEMFAQPIVDLHTERITGVELLARWRHEGEWIPPDVFIPIAEDSGLIQAVGRWAMGCACSLLEDLKAAGCDQSVSVNISGLHLIGGEVVAELRSLLEGTTFDRSKLRVELTESFLLSDPDLAARRLGEIRDLGAKIVIDDFGTGYSSLTYLHALPIDGLKLDRSFVSRLGVDESDETIVRLVNDLAVGLHLDLVAEGVETAEQHRTLLGHGYPLGQGYLWSRPVPIRELWPLLEQNRLAQVESSSA
ncbi:MAG: EAL domain-containing protein [Acidimicrobiales bacterium]